MDRHAALVAGDRLFALVRTALVAGALSAAAFVPALARAQGVEFTRAEAASCLAYPGTTALPEYPDSFLADAPALVRVEMEFERPDQGPNADLVFSKGNEVFAKIVREHAGRARWPCLVPGQRVRVLQEFQFIPGKPNRVLASDTAVSRNAADIPSECLDAIRKLPRPQLGYALHHGSDVLTKDGKVLVELKFTSPDDAPEMKVLFGDDNRGLVATARRYTAAYRLPCVNAADPIIAKQVFDYHPRGSVARRLKEEMTIVEFVRAIRNVSEQKVRFDFDTMACPFKFRFEPWMPYASNNVREIEPASPGRRLFLDWARKVTLDIPPELMRTAGGEASTVTVPCGFMDLSL